VGSIDRSTRGALLRERIELEYRRDRADRRALRSQAGAADTALEGLTRFFDGRIKFDNALSNAPSVRSPSTGKMRSSQAPTRRRALRRHRFADRNLKAPRCPSTRLSCTLTARRGVLGRHMPGSAAHVQQPAFGIATAFCSCERTAVRPSAQERSTTGEVMSTYRVFPAPPCVNGPAL
jgi:hypothetical protein